MMSNSQPNLTAQNIQMTQGYQQMNQAPMMQITQSTYRPGPVNVVAPMMPLNTTTIISSPACATHPTARSNQRLFCPNCHSATISNVQFIPGGGATIICFVLFLFIGFFGLIAFCVDDCKDVHHYCSICGSHLGEVRFLLE